MSELRRKGEILDERPGVVVEREPGAKVDH